MKVILSSNEKKNLFITVFYLITCFFFIFVIYELEDEKDSIIERKNVEIQQLENQVNELSDSIEENGFKPYGGF